MTPSWEQRKLGELCTFSKGHGYSKADIKDAGTPLILYGRLYTQYESRIEEVDTFTVEQDESILSSGNEVIVPASGETAEDIAVASSVRRSGIILGGDLNVVTPTAKLDPDYTALAITYSKAHDDLAKRAQGKSVVHVHGNDIAEVEVSYPSESEQKRISSVVLNLDSLITLHQRKRCNGPFMHPLVWEQRKLGELGSVAMCKRIFKEQTTEQGDVPFYKIGTFGGTPDAFISRELFDEYQRLYQFPKVGDILISAAGTIGRTIVYQGDSAYYQDSNIVWLQHDERLDNGFLLQFLNGKSWSSLEGSTLKRLYNKDLLNAEIATPSPDEQHQIGSTFAKLDDIITLHQ